LALFLKIMGLNILPHIEIQGLNLIEQIIVWTAVCVAVFGTKIFEVNIKKNE
jgi:hypothetical protein